MLRNIIIPVDVNVESSWKEALPTAVKMAKADGAHLHLLYVLPDVSMGFVDAYIPEEFRNKPFEDAKAGLAKLKKKQLPDDVKVSEYVRKGTIYKEILELVEDTNADLIVMASHRPELVDYLLGPNAARVVRHAPCSVYVVR